MATGRKFNFSAGPATLPESVLAELREAVWSVDGTGIGLLEHSHRAEWFMRVAADTEAAVRAAFGAGEDWSVTFMQGGASLHFNLLPLNFLPLDAVADYPDTDVWSAKAIREGRALHEAGLCGRVAVPFDGQTSDYDHAPAQTELRCSPQAAYFHYCSNNTVRGTRFATAPRVDAPLFCDVSSEALSRPIDLARHSLIYATAQKNLGAAGLVLVLARRELLARARRDLPSMLSYPAFEKAQSMPNTPHTTGIWLLGRMVRWVLTEGGVAEMERRAAHRAGLLYAEIDRSGGFYHGLSRPDCRSHMNVSFRLPSAELDSHFAREAAAQGMVTLEGHREVGGIRASIYNAFPLAGVQALASFMREFAKSNG